MITFQNPVLIVIDMQNGFLGSRSNYIIPSVVQLVEECQKRKIPTVFTRFHNRENSPYERLIGWTRLRNAPETDLTPELSQFAQTIIDKDFYSSFTEEFAELVKKNDWRTLILCGVATESCVMKTAVDAFEKGFTPIVISDACASHAGEDVHASGLMILGRFIGKDQLVTSNDLIRKLDTIAAAING
ncbi:MAG: cysteine hydrolase [Chloracidobacterium sp.]|nr:cysteine hydrolase [Chloracidobacterium sp.]